MKKTLITLTASGFMLAGVLTGCNSPTTKVENAKENLQEAKEELHEAQADSISEYISFKNEMDERINTNEKSIAAFKERMVTDKKQVKAKDQKVIDELEQRNINMRKRIDEYKEEGKGKWETFKAEFTHDMDELGHAIKDLTVKNTK